MFKKILKKLCLFFLIIFSLTSNTAWSWSFHRGPNALDVHTYEAQHYGMGRQAPVYYDAPTQTEYVPPEKDLKHDEMAHCSSLNSLYDILKECSDLISHAKLVSADKDNLSSAIATKMLASIEKAKKDMPIDEKESEILRKKSAMCKEINTLGDSLSSLKFSKYAEWNSHRDIPKIFPSVSNFMKGNEHSLVDGQKFIDQLKGFKAKIKNEAEKGIDDDIKLYKKRNEEEKEKYLSEYKEKLQKISKQLGDIRPKLDASLLTNKKMDKIEEYANDLIARQQEIENEKKLEIKNMDKELEKKIAALKVASSRNILNPDLPLYEKEKYTRDFEDYSDALTDAYGERREITKNVLKLKEGYCAILAKMTMDESVGQHNSIAADLQNMNRSAKEDAASVAVKDDQKRVGKRPASEEETPKANSSSSTLQK